MVPSMDNQHLCLTIINVSQTFIGIMSTGFQCGVCPGHGKVTQNRWLKWYIKQSIVSIKVKRNIVMPSAYSFMSPMAQQKQE